jgi:diadenosine tetraphosphate (Ap4A) HIT family hydrolase
VSGTALPPAQLHPRLAADSHVLGALPASLLLLHREAALHWFILVPATACADVTDLPAAQRNALLDDAAALAAELKGHWGYPKVNIGALGNVVPQLHLHVVGRRPEDYCWPGPVWGAPAPGRAYRDGDIAAIGGRLRQSLALRPAA